MGVHGVPTANFVFEDVRVPRTSSWAGGGEGRGFNHAMLPEHLRPVVGARGLGLAEGA